MTRRPLAYLASRAVIIGVPTLLAATVLAPTPVQSGTPTEAVPVVTTVPVQEAHPAALLMGEHDCWTGDAPPRMRGQLPGHVVVTKTGADGPVYGGPRLVGQALDQTFAGGDHGLTVWGFCA